ncbi:nuclear transport factor 2 family protein [Nocardia miyunensis]|uniref:nuclear transport factor 2 family protein n=1 Tax=Nocardia miyunensis TaxID=282684 RepID=UPI00082BCFDB|nr:nuclear transport factor 2 family protein [Nocardia miyunensis]
MTDMTEGNADVVREFYRAIAERDGDALARLVQHRFAPEASVTWPDSLPYGGTIAGARKLAKVFAGLASAPTPVGPSGTTLTDLVDGGDRIAAQLEFDWHAPGSGQAVRSGALELWTFADGLVQELRAYYWDTAACVAASSPA